MINRELFEAYKGRFGESVALDKIYDSIGTCSECKHMEVIDSGAGIISCTRATFDPIEPDFFCADFERKVNEII